MYKLDLPIDLRESAAIQRRKIKEQQRQSRIFNARVRTIGVSLHFDFFTSLHFHTKILTFFKPIVLELLQSWKTPQMRDKKKLKICQKNMIK